MLAKTSIDANTSLAGFESWLQGQLGAGVRANELVNYLERKHVDAGQILYREGEPADTIDLVASGDIGIDLKEKGVRVRRIRSTALAGTCDPAISCAIHSASRASSRGRTHRITGNLEASRREATRSNVSAANTGRVTMKSAPASTLYSNRRSSRSRSSAPGFTVTPT